MEPHAVQLDRLRPFRCRPHGRTRGHNLTDDHLLVRQILGLCEEQAFRGFLLRCEDHLHGQRRLAQSILPDLLVILQARHVAA